MSKTYYFSVGIILDDEEDENVEYNTICDILEESGYELESEVE